MNHSKRECKDAIGTGVHAHFPQVFIPPLHFSVATGFACFVTATEFELEDTQLRRLSYQQKECHPKTYTDRHAQNVPVSKRHTSTVCR
jgi:hypothetical protein